MQIKKRQFTESKQLGTFRNHFGYGHISEYSFETTRKFCIDSALELLKENGLNVFGFTFFSKEEIDYSIEQMAKVFRYVVREVEYV